MMIQQHLRAATAWAARWHVHSQETSRRNAMAASTALMQRRLEVDEVERFLRLHQRQRDARSGQTTPQATVHPVLRHRTA